MAKRQAGGSPLFLATAIGLCMATTAQAQEAENTPESSSGDIVVTASKRDSLLSRTPETMSALDGDALLDSGAQGIESLQGKVPNFAFAQNFGVTQVFVRGVGNTFFTVGGDPGVAFYADGVYVSDQETSNAALFDVERVEVLRGPQGTLYGRNATGGALNVVYAKPTEDLSGRVEVGIGDYGRLQSNGFVSGSLGGGVKARLSYDVRHLNGFTRNEFNGAGAPKRLDDLDSQALRLQLAIPISSEGSLELTAGYYHQDDNGPAMKVLPDAFPHTAELLFGAREPTSARNVESNVSINRRETWNVTGRLNQPIGDARLVFTADYRESDRYFQFDDDGTEADVTRVTFDTRSKQTSLEAYVISNEDARFTWLVGGTYVKFDQTGLIEIPTTVPAAALGLPLPPLTPIPLLFQFGGPLDSEAYAGYFELGYKFSDIVKLTGGLRYSHDSKRSDEFFNFSGTLFTASPDASWSKVTGRIRLEIQPNNQTLFYGTVSQGYKSGAINVGGVTPPVDPETILNFEIGAKASLFDRRLQLSAALFNSNYKNLQILRITQFNTLLTNAARARIQGLEAEGSLRASSNLKFNFAVGLLNAKFQQFSAPNPRLGFATFDLTGNRLPYTSKFQGTIGAEFTTAVGEGNQLSLRTDYVYRSKLFFNEFNTGDAAQRGYGRWDASATLDLGDRWQVSAFIRNIANSTAIGSMNIQSPILGSIRVVNLEPPRHFGISAAVKF